MMAARFRSVLLQAGSCMRGVTSVCRSLDLKEGDETLNILQQQPFAANAEKNSVK